MPETVTQLLQEWRDGRREALDRLVPLVYDELRRRAGARLREERPGHTLAPTALVHEAYLRLVGADVDWQDRVHFFAVAARLMRQILVDHARTRNRVKRGSGARPVTLDEAVAVTPAAASPALVDLDDALADLARQDERKARVLELHLFAGLTYEEIGTALSLSPATVHRELRLARAWLERELRHRA
jgi:RNA polymerase sigma factor (TIGR02999 family)